MRRPSTRRLQTDSAASDARTESAIRRSRTRRLADLGRDIRTPSGRRRGLTRVHGPAAVSRSRPECWTNCHADSSTFSHRSTSRCCRGGVVAGADDEARRNSTSPVLGSAAPSTDGGDRRGCSPSGAGSPVCPETSCMPPGTHVAANESLGATSAEICLDDDCETIGAQARDDDVANGFSRHVWAEGESIRLRITVFDEAGNVIEPLNERRKMDSKRCRCGVLQYDWNDGRLHDQLIAPTLLTLQSRSSTAPEQSALRCQAPATGCRAQLRDPAERRVRTSLVRAQAPRQIGISLFRVADRQRPSRAGVWAPRRGSTGAGLLTIANLASTDASSTRVGRPTRV